MTKKKDFYGKDITTTIEQACIELGVSQEQLSIEVIETGSAGIFGLCRKKAHIRVSPKDAARKKEAVPPAQKEKKPKTKTEPAESVSATVVSPGETSRSKLSESGQAKAEAAADPTGPAPAGAADAMIAAGPVPGEIPETERQRAVQQVDQELLDRIQADLRELLALMQCPSDVRVTTDSSGVLCHVTGPYEEEIIGDEGRTLDSLQYLLRKMMSQQLPDRAVLTIDVGDFRERRAEELRKLAVELAQRVEEDGRTQAIPALNPSERRVVHMVLQDDKNVRSRSVGDGLFKKILIYKPGKTKKADGRKRKGRQGGRTASE